MTTSRSRLRTSILAVVLVAVAVLSSGCGGNDVDASAKRPEKAQTTATATPTPTSSPTSAPTAPVTPESRFEGRPEVQALRSWAAASARDVNARRHDFPTAREFQVDSPDTMNDVTTSWRQDFDKYYPGPLPFTPIAVSRAGGRSVVTACVTSTGFSLKKPGGKPAEKPGVLPIAFTMAKPGDSWLLADIVAATADCKGVRIAPVQW